MSTMKRTVLVSLDEDLVKALEAGSEPLSSQVNEAVRVELARRRHRAQLHEMPEEVDCSDGPVDEALVDKYTELLTRSA